MQTTSQVLIDGPRNFVIRLTGVQDSSGLQLTALKVVDVTLMNPPAGPHLKVRKLDWRVLGGIVELLWEQSVGTPVAFAELQLADHLDWRNFGGESTRTVANATGSILLSTRSFDVGSSYDLTLECIKGVGNPNG